MKQNQKVLPVGELESGQSPRRRINLLDILFLIVILAIIAAVVSFFLPGSLFGLGGEQVAVSFTIELKLVNGGMAENIRVGDSVFDAAGKSPIGKVSEVARTDSTKMVYNQETGQIEEVAFPANIDGKVPQNLRITIEAIADYSPGSGYVVGGSRVSVGSDFTLCFTGYTGTGKCVALVVAGK